MYRLGLVIVYVLLSIVSYYLPSVFVSDSQVFVFALICVHLLKELDWIMIKDSCKSSKSKFCKMFKKSPKKNDTIEVDASKNMDP